MIVIDHLTNVLHIARQIDDVVQLPLRLRPTTHHSNELGHTAIVALKEHLLTSVLVGRWLRVSRVLNPRHQRMPLSSLEGQRHRADNHARSRTPSANLTVEHEVVLRIGEGDSQQIVDRRGQRRLLVCDRNAEQRNLEIGGALVNAAIHLFQLRFTHSTHVYSNNAAFRDRKQMHHALVLFVLVIHHDHGLIDRRLLENVLLELPLDFQHTLSTREARVEAARVNAGKDQVVDHIGGVSQRVGLAVDENDRLFAQIHPRLIITSSRGANDIPPSVRALDVLHRVYDSADHRNALAEHAVHKAAHSEIGGPIELRHLHFTRMNRSYEMHVARPREIVVLDDGVQIQHQTVNVLVHKGMRFVLGCFRIAGQCILRLVTIRHRRVNARDGGIVPEVRGRRENDRLGVVQRVQNQLDLRPSSQPLRERHRVSRGFVVLHETPLPTLTSR